MNKVRASLFCIIFAICLGVARADRDHGPLARSIYSLEADAILASRNILPDFPARLAEKRQEVFAYTRENLNGHLGRFEWAIPVVALYEWSHFHERRTYEQSTSDLRELFDILRAVPDHNRPNSAQALAGSLSGYGQKWLYSLHAPEALVLIDDIRNWLIETPEGEHQWNVRNGHTVIRVLTNEAYFEPGQRERLRTTWGEILRRMIEYPGLPGRMRHDYVAHWANALYNNGHGELAHRIMQSWWRRNEGKISDQHFFAVWMKILLYDRLDIESAGQLLEHANSFDESEMRHPQRQHRQNAAMFYYNALQLPDYEIRRLRNIELRKRLETRERARAMYLKLQREENAP